MPNYLSLLESGELHDRALTLEECLRDCTLCPRECRVDRLKGEQGFCRSGHLPIVESSCAHRGEEPALSGTRGSGTIFFGRCNLRCVFCQNHQISQPSGSVEKYEVSVERLAAIMLELQAMGCHNINFVSPTHFAAQIVRGVEIAASKGLRVPLVYNTNGYDSIHTLRLLDGVIDIYRPEPKHSVHQGALGYAERGDYGAPARSAIVEM